MFIGREKNKGSARMRPQTSAVAAEAAFPYSRAMWHRIFLLFAMVSGLLTGCSHHHHDSAKITSPASSNLLEPQPYSRVAHPDSNTVQLQIAVRRFVPVDHRGPTIWLTATAHVGEPQYYH